MATDAVDEPPESRSAESTDERDRSRSTLDKGFHRAAPYSEATEVQAGAGGVRLSSGRRAPEPQSHAAGGAFRQAAKRGYRPVAPLGLHIGRGQAEVDGSSDE